MKLPRLMSSRTFVGIAVLAVAFLVGYYLKPCNGQSDWGGDWDFESESGYDGYDGFRVPGFQGGRKPARDRPMRIRVQFFYDLALKGKPSYWDRYFVTVRSEEHARQIIRERISSATDAALIAAVYWLRRNRGDDFIKNDPELPARQSYPGEKLLDSAYQSVRLQNRFIPYRACADPGGDKDCCKAKHMYGSRC